MRIIGGTSLTMIKGYLRTAKILQLQEKYKAAADIYRYGLRNVPPSESNFKVSLNSKSIDGHRLISVGSSYVRCTTE